MKNKCLKILNMLYKVIDDILLIAGICLVSYGIFLIYIPAGYIILGICLLALAFFIAKKKVVANAYSKFNK